jgi:hypothetical protein
MSGFEDEVVETDMSKYYITQSDVNVVRCYAL